MFYGLYAEGEAGDDKEDGDGEGAGVEDADDGELEEVVIRSIALGDIVLFKRTAICVFDLVVDVVGTVEEEDEQSCEPAQTVEVAGRMYLSGL